VDRWTEKGKKLEVKEGRTKTMAKMLPILGDIKGSIGNITFRKSMNGPMTMVCKPACKVPGTIGPSQEIDRNRARLAYLARMWAYLDNTERQAWRDWASNHPQPDGFGGTFTMSGINAFIQLNHTRMRMDLSADYNHYPPIAQPPAAIDIMTAATGEVASSIDLTWTFVGTNVNTDAVEVAISAPFASAGKVASMKYVKNRQTSGQVGLVTVDGLCPEMWYWCRVRYVCADGQTTPWIEKQAKSAAAA